jgi:hypothetical protein
MGATLIKCSSCHSKIALRIILEVGGHMTRQGVASKVERQVENDSPALWSDDECVQRLAALIEYRDSGDLKKLASLIGRLAVPVALPGL